MIAASLVWMPGLALAQVPPVMPNFAESYMQGYNAGRGRSEQAPNIALLLYGGSGHDTYLGCLNCVASNPESVCSAYGKFGSKYSAVSIWNAYGDYGSKYNSNSPWSKYPTSPPVVVDPEGNFYGYLTAASSYDKKTQLEPLRALIAIASSGDLSAAREYFCGQ